MNTNEFKCHICGGIFEKKRDDTWSEEKARAEAEQFFPGMPKECSVTVCSTCWEVWRPDKHQEAYQAYIAERN
jgi:hypothetical protein